MPARRRCWLRCARTLSRGRCGGGRGALAEHGSDNVAIVLLGVLNANNAIEEAGLAAQMKAKREDEAAAGVPEPVGGMADGGERA